MEKEKQTHHSCLEIFATDFPEFVHIQSCNQHQKVVSSHNEPRGQHMCIVERTIREAFDPINCACNEPKNNCEAMSPTVVVPVVGMQKQQPLVTHNRGTKRKVIHKQTQQTQSGKDLLGLLFGLFHHARGVQHAFGNLLLTIGILCGQHHIYSNAVFTADREYRRTQDCESAHTAHQDTKGTRE